MKLKLTFEDQGQDFLTWTIEDGKILDCQPFQFSVWSQWTVLNRRFDVGRLLHIKKGDQTMTIKYPIIKIERVSDDGVISQDWSLMGEEEKEKYIRELVKISGSNYSYSSTEWGYIKRLGLLKR